MITEQIDSLKAHLGKVSKHLMLGICIVQKILNILNRPIARGGSLGAEEPPL